MARARPTPELNKAWQTKFAIMDKVPSDDGPWAFINSSQSLERDERFKVIINVWAAIFTIFYYFAKGMWLKGLFLVGVATLINSLILITGQVFGISSPQFIPSIPMMIICGGLANYDYYQFQKRGEVIWPQLPMIFAQTRAVVAFGIAGLTIWLIVFSNIVGATLP